ncbi:MAG TPA: serine dehydratase, partial [Bacillus sp. (in: firmicutes)]|nr:serine dehydratase [Bacillus sp. (in: firmicutes)]
MSFTNLKELIELAEKEETTIAEVMIKVEIEQGGHSRSSILDKMTEQLEVMIDSVRKGTESPVMSRTGLTGGDGNRVYEYAQSGNSFVNPQTLLVLS